MAKKQDTGKIEIENRRARFEYAISETLETGIALRGSEVKSVRDGLVNLTDGYVRVQESPRGMFLHNVHIGEYKPAGMLGHKPTRPRPLLAHKREIDRIAKALEQKGATAVPLKLYFKDGWAKVLIGVGFGKQKHDKRRSIGEREAKREMDRATSRRL